MSTTRLGRALPVSTPPEPNRISFRSSVVETIVKTVAQCAMAVLSVTTSAPIRASGSALELVRFQTDRPWPAFTRRAAIASPIRPRPIQPTLCDALLPIERNLCASFAFPMRASLRRDEVAVHVYRQDPFPGAGGAVRRCPCRLRRDDSQQRRLAPSRQELQQRARRRDADCGGHP